MLLNCLDVFQICELLLTTAPSLCKRIDAAMFDLMSFFGFITFLVSLGMSTFLEKKFREEDDWSKTNTVCERTMVFKISGFSVNEMSKGSGHTTIFLSRF